MTRDEAIKNLNTMVLAASEPEQYISIGSFEEVKETIKKAIKSLEAWEKIDDEIASLQDTYSIGGTDTEKAIWENLQAVRKTIHEYLKEVGD